MNDFELASQQIESPHNQLDQVRDGFQRLVDNGLVNGVFDPESQQLTWITFERRLQDTNRLFAIDAAGQRALIANIDDENAESNRAKLMEFIRNPQQDHSFTGRDINLGLSSGDKHRDIALEALDDHLDETRENKNRQPQWLAEGTKKAAVILNQYPEFTNPSPKPTP